MEYREDWVADYRRKAEEAERAAERASDPVVKKSYEVLARSWLDLAKRLERP
jgi:hypothetical protein